MSQVLISFIIPIYNGEEYIDRCLKSILNSNNLDFEILLINDGSTDKSKEICEDYVAKNSRIKLINTENNGQGKARNIALGNIKGKYIMFADIDDEVILSGVINMLNIATAHDYDIVCSPYYRIDKDSEALIENDFSSGLVSKYKCNEELARYNKIRDRNVFGYLVTKVFKASFIKENNLKFSEERKVFMEDSLFNHKTMIYKPKYYYTDVPSYRVDASNVSTTRSANPQIVENSIKTVGELYYFLKNSGKLADNTELISPLAMRVFSYAMVKNIPYEGLSYKTIRNSIKVYINSNAYKELVNTKNAYKPIKKLNSFAEKVLYTLCFYGLKFKMATALACMFYMNYPLFKIYLNKNVK